MAIDLATQLLFRITFFSLCLPSLAGFHLHDASFQPDYILVATAQNVLNNCESRYSVILNGTSPGPTLHMREGHTTWVRVYNNIEDQNLTVVRWYAWRLLSETFANSQSTGTDLPKERHRSQMALHKCRSGPSRR